MKTEPVIDRGVLMARVREVYRIDLEALTFVPIGQNSCAYRGDVKGGQRYLLKLLGPHPLGWTDPAHLDFYLTLTRVLSERGYPARVVAPVRAADGALWTRCGDGSDAPPLVVYPFVEGHSAGSEWRRSDPALAAVARTLGRMHRDTAELRRVVPAAARHVEGFDVPFERELLASLDALEGGAVPSDPIAEELRRVLVPRRRQVLGYLDRLRELHQIVRAAYPTSDRMVLCHTDVNPFNLLIGGRGDVYLLDWEGARLAPPEQDLRYILTAAAGRTDFAMAHYEDEFGPATIGADVLAFYKYHRPLFEIAYYCRRILAPDANATQRRSDLREIVDGVVAWWDQLPADVAALTAVIAGRARS